MPSSESRTDPCAECQFSPYLCLAGQDRATYLPDERFDTAGTTVDLVKCDLAYYFGSIVSVNEKVRLA